MTLLFLVVVAVLGSVLSTAYQMIFKTSAKLHQFSSRLHAKSRMPQFNDEEKAALERMLSGEEPDINDYDDLMGYEELPDDDPYAFEADPNQAAPKKKPTSPPPPPLNPVAPATPGQQKPKTFTASVSKPPPKPAAKPLMQSNSDWRSAYSGSTPTEQRRPPKQAPQQSAFDFTDLDYDDFEAAMNEVDNAGLGMNMGSGMMASKVNVAPPTVHKGLYSGDIVGGNIWK